MSTWAGSCHCGKVRFEVDTTLDRVTECNCSICSKKGILHHRVKPENFRMLAGEHDLGTYRFGTMVAKHHFCTTCGIHVFTRPRAAPELYTVNVRCLEGVDLATLTVTPFDGRNFDASVGTLK
ncbi:MAG TPA: GFA family protein [Burkholderiales bacterium]